MWDSDLSFFLDLAPFWRDSCMREEGSNSASEPDSEGPASKSISWSPEGGTVESSTSKSFGGSGSTSTFPSYFLDFLCFRSLLFSAFCSA